MTETINYNDSVLTNPKEFESKENFKKRKEIFEKYKQTSDLMNIAKDIYYKNNTIE